MTTQQDAQVGGAIESVFGTGVTPTRFPEFLSESFNWMPTFTDNNGMRVGRIVKAADRRVLTKSEVGGDLEVELFSKGLGWLFQAAMGVGTSTVISGSAYQQNFTLTNTDYLSSYTLQVGVPTLGGGAGQPQTFTGMVCNGFDITLPNEGIPTVKFPWMGKAVTTATALAAASYISGNGLFAFPNATVTLGTGAFVAPTTTALATLAGGATVDIRDINVTLSNSLDGNGFNFGANGLRARPPAVGDRQVSGSLTVEYDVNTWRDAFMNQTDMSLLITLALPVAISGANYPTLQIAIPDIRFDDELPKPNSGEVITQTIKWTGLDNRVNAPIYVSLVTAETAI